jgi:Flp pilus assembly protein TadG
MSAWSRQRRGATAVELAIVAPVLFLLVVGTLELWRVHMFLHTASQAAYQATRLGVVPGIMAEDVEQAALNLMASVGARETEVIVDPPVITDETETITVTVNVPMAANGWIVPRFFTEPNVTGRSSLTRESKEL